MEGIVLEHHVYEGKCSRTPCVWREVFQDTLYMEAIVLEHPVYVGKCSRTPGVWREVF